MITHFTSVVTIKLLVVFYYISGQHCEVQKAYSSLSTSKFQFVKWYFLTTRNIKLCVCVCMVLIIWYHFNVYPRSLKHNTNTVSANSLEVLSKSNRRYPQMLLMNLPKYETCGCMSFHNVNADTTGKGLSSPSLTWQVYWPSVRQNTSYCSLYSCVICFTLSHIFPLTGSNTHTHKTQCVPTGMQPCEEIIMLKK